jgi:hypothetical protein
MFTFKTTGGSVFPIRSKRFGAILMVFRTVERAMDFLLLLNISYDAEVQPFDGRESETVRARLFGKEMIYLLLEVP